MRLWLRGTSRQAPLKFPVTILRGSHPFPSRTRKLSLAGPMVLRAQVRGRLGDRRNNLEKAPQGNLRGFFCVCRLLIDYLVFDSILKVLVHLPVRIVRYMNLNWEPRLV